MQMATVFAALAQIKARMLDMVNSINSGENSINSF